FPYRRFLSSLTTHNRRWTRDYLKGSKIFYLEGRKHVDCGMADLVRPDLLGDATPPRSARGSYICRCIRKWGCRGGRGFCGVVQRRKGWGGLRLHCRDHLGETPGH